MKKQNKRTKSKKKSRKNHKKSSNNVVSSNSNVRDNVAKARIRNSGSVIPLPERAAIKKNRGNANSLNQKKSFLDKISQFLREAKSELIKVKWPNKKELLSTTIVVIVLSLFVAFYLGAVDFLLIKTIKIVVR